MLGGGRFLLRSRGEDCGLQTANICGGQSQEAKAAAIDFRGLVGEGLQRRFAVIACSLCNALMSTQSTCADSTSCILRLIHA